MACKLICPKCEKVLKEEGDETKSSQGEYRVYDSLANSKNAEGKYRVILCLSCKKFSFTSEFYEKEYKPETAYILKPFQDDII